VVVSTANIEWLNTAETARRLGVTPRTLYRFIDDGQLPAYRFGRVIRLKESEVAEFIESCRINPGSLDDGLDVELDKPVEASPPPPDPLPPSRAHPQRAEHLGQTLRSQG